MVEDILAFFISRAAAGIFVVRSTPRLPAAAPAPNRSPGRRARHAAFWRCPGRAIAVRSAPALSDDRRRRLPEPAAGTRGRPAGRPSPRNRTTARAAKTVRTIFPVLTHALA